MEMRLPWVRFWTAVILVVAICADAQTIFLPPRPAASPSGSEFVQRIALLDLANREQEIFSQVNAGNVPDFFREFCPVIVTNVSAGRTNTATFFAAPDYFAVGADEDYCLMPMTPVIAQQIADQLGCSLPTRKMVNDIYTAADVKLAPSPIPPSPAMITVPVFGQHNAIVRTQRLAQLAAHPLGALVAGDKKDVVITAKAASTTNRVAIYGWHQTNGAAIQPLYLGHIAAWVDYSHGIRLVQKTVSVNGQPKDISEVLSDPKLAGLLSDEGVILESRYQTNGLPSLPAQMKNVFASTRTNRAVPTFADFRPSGKFGELTTSFTFEPEVRIHINAPKRESFTGNNPVMLVFFALPNGNTIEQTIGRKVKPNDDWHYDIQHIGAQTRFLREHLTNHTIVVAYLETEMKSWPAWRKKHGDRQIPQIVGSVKGIFGSNSVEVVLMGHSGGGAFTFGYINAVKEIPRDVQRIAFLDSNYAYEKTNHLAKLAVWLKSHPQHALCVLAYHDSIALLDGKSFVSERGGTWGRSHAMLGDLSGYFQFTNLTNSWLRTHSALAGRVQFLLKENPEKKILHTVQVERNGFIQSMVSGLPQEGKGYEYLGERAYGSWILAD